MVEHDIARIDAELRDHRELLSKIALRLEHTVVLQQQLFDRMDDSTTGLESTRMALDKHVLDAARDVASWKRLKIQFGAFVLGAVIFSRVVDAVFLPKAAPKIEDIKKAIAQAISDSQANP